MTNTATVQTLTAEVRVLQVGNRQITLSVVNQLDRCRYEELEPMGRVHSSRKDAPDYPRECSTQVVGRRYEDGALVFAFAPVPQILAPPEWLHWMYHRSKNELDSLFAHGGEYTQNYPVPAPWNDGYRHTENVFLYRLLPMIMDEDTPDEHQFKWAYTTSAQHCRTDRQSSHDPELWHDGEYCNLPALKEAWEWAAEEQCHEGALVAGQRAEAEALPLIMLAGLK